MSDPLSGPPDDPHRGAPSPRRHERVGRDPRFSRAFLASFGACSVSLTAVLVLGFLVQVSDTVLMPLLSITGLVAVGLLGGGVVMVMTGRRPVGLGLVLGVVAAVVVGVVLCSGLLIFS